MAGKRQINITKAEADRLLTKVRENDALLNKLAASILTADEFQIFTHGNFWDLVRQCCMMGRMWAVDEKKLKLFQMRTESLGHRDRLGCMMQLYGSDDVRVEEENFMKPLSWADVARGKKA